MKLWTVFLFLYVVFKGWSSVSPRPKQKKGQKDTSRGLNDPYGFNE